MMRSLRAFQTAVFLMLATVCRAGMALPMPPSTATTVTVPAPPASPKGAAPAEQRLVLHVQDLRLPPGSSGIVRIFVDLPADKAVATAETEPSADDPHYLGYVSVLPKTSTEASAGLARKEVTVDLTPKAALLRGKPQITLTLVALGGAVGSSEKPHAGRVYFADK